MTSDNGGPAFPVSNGVDTDHGMTLRDYFAGQALVGLASGDYIDSGSGEDIRNIGTASYILADVMLAARNKETPHE